MSLSPPEPNGPPDDPGSAPYEPRLLTRRNHLDDDFGDRDARGSEKVRAPQPPAHAAFVRSPSRSYGDEQPPHTRRRFLPRKLLKVLAALAVLAILALLATTLWLRHTLRAALPQLDGTLHVPGLSAPVTVTRNAQDVPSITAANLNDLLFAQGFVTASDRLWQMDALRRHASGQLAAILGPRLVEHDRLQRTLQLGPAADRILAVLPADQLHQLQAYAAGVNAFIAQSESGGESGHRTLPIEFHVLHYQPAPWTPRDSLLVALALAQDLSTGFPTKLRREALAPHLPPDLLADLYPVGSWRDRPPTEPQPDLTSPKPEILQIPLDRSQSLLRQPQLAAPRDILHLAREFPDQHCDTCRSGSNNWAVAASRSASGAPLVSNDMHLALSAPDIWYEAALHAPASTTAPALDVTGFTLPGVPFVIVGRNLHVAWSFTNLGADVQDIHIEHLRGSGSSLQFERANGSWSPVLHHLEHIRVRGGRDVSLDLLSTTAMIGPTEIQTPLLSPLFPTEHRALSLAWTLYDPTNVSLPLLAADTATDGASLVASLAGFGVPALNLIYADDAGHIGYHALGRIPIRGPAIQHPRATPAIPFLAPLPDEDGDLSEPQPDFSPQTLAAPQSNAPTGDPLNIVTAAPADTTAYTIGSPLSPVPVDALDSTQAWSGYIPYNALPSIIDPPGGVLATANARITPDDYPYAITLNWAPPYRVERIYKQLDGRTNVTPADMLALQNDVHSAFDLVLAQRLAYALDHASPSVLDHDRTRLHQAANILRSWSGDVSASAVAPTIVAAVQKQLWPMLLLPQIAAHDHIPPNSTHARTLAALYQWEEQDDALESLVQNTPARWLPPGFANWNDFLATAAAHALDAAPSNLNSWHYGPEHPVAIEHPFFSSLPFFDRLLGVATGSGPRATGGDATTVRASGLHFGPTERFTADLASPHSTTANITTGESGDPASPHYFDQFLPWLHGTTFPLPLQPTSTTHTLTLLP